MQDLLCAITFPAFATPTAPRRADRSTFPSLATLVLGFLWPGWALFTCIDFLIPGKIPDLNTGLRDKVPVDFPQKRDKVPVKSATKYPWKTSAFHGGFAHLSGAWRQGEYVLLDRRRAVMQVDTALIHLEPGCRVLAMNLAQDVAEHAAEVPHAFVAPAELFFEAFPGDELRFAGFNAV